MKRTSKYNATKVEYDGIKWDSKAEMNYYCHLKKLKAQGVVSWFDMQPEFILLGGFTDNFGRKHLPIKYRADFLVHYTDAPPVVVDIKGMETPDFKLKRKMYCSRFPLELKLIAYSATDGGWIETDELKKARKVRKKEKEALDNEILHWWKNVTRVKRDIAKHFGVTLARVNKVIIKEETK